MTFVMTPTERDDAPAAVRRTNADGEPIRARDFLDLDFRVLLGFLPSLVFLIADRAASTQIAIALSFAATVLVFVNTKSHGVIRFLSTFGFTIVAASAVLGLALDSDRAFVAQNIFSDIAFAAAYIGSVIIGKPLVGAIARELVPGIKPVMLIGLPVFVKLTLLSAGTNIASAIVRYFMLENMSTEAYVILSRAVFIPVNIAFVALCYVSITRTAIRIWPDDMPYEHLRRRGRAPTPLPATVVCSSRCVTGAAGGNHDRRDARRHEAGRPRHRIREARGGVRARQTRRR
jgi:hypothetical protein